jgi:hypothetical protein
MMAMAWEVRAMDLIGDDGMLASEMIDRLDAMFGAGGFFGKPEHKKIQLLLEKHAALESRLLTQTEMLRRLEWRPIRGLHVCPICDGNLGTGHAQGCELKELLRAKGD